MRRFHALALLALFAAAPSALRAQAPAASPSAPDVGQLAPDFTASLVDAASAKAAPVTLSSLRGKVVVLAFYPKDRTSGCTAELTKFRDEYSSLFGSDVMVLPVSADSVDSHVSWGQEMKFPFGLVSDPSLTLADSYGSRMAGRPFSNRTVFVIGRDGRIVWRDMKFSALSEDAYTQLASAVAKARK
jgi:thioredoxin-dependent peroxiredoxin